MKRHTLILVVLSLYLTLLACGMCGPQSVCGAGQLSPPLQTYPGADAILADLTTAYKWEYGSPDCIPAGYHLVVSDQAGLSDPEIDLRQANPIMMWSPDIELKDCTAYYWKVAAIAEDQDGPFSEVSIFRTDMLGTCFLPMCPQGESVAPVPVAPQPGSITGTRPELSWQYPLNCQPESFVIQLSSRFDFEEASLIHESSETGNKWSPSSPLVNASTYYWRVAAKIGAVVGPFSDVQWFYTGPKCTDETELVAPELVVPLKGETFSHDQVYLQWRPGNLACIPDGYYRELQIAPDFSGFNLLLGIFNKPVTTILTPGLNDCTRYFWRVAAIQDGVRGPKSSPRSFIIEISDECGAQMPMGQVALNVNCRKGANTDFDVVRILLQGEWVELIGRNQALTSLLVQLPHSAGQCWSAIEFIEPTIDPRQLPVIIEPTLPEPEPEQTICHKGLSEAECLSAGGEWKFTVGLSGGVFYYCDCP